MRQLTRRARRAGFTLVEMMVVIAIVAILTVVGLPTYADYIENARLREGANLIVSGSLLARSEAVKRNATVRVRVVGQRLDVSQDDGVTVTTLRSIELPGALQVSAFSASFDSAGRLAPFGTDVVVLLSSNHRACDADIRCPAVHLQAGGSVSICKTGVCS